MLRVPRTHGAPSYGLRLSSAFSSVRKTLQGCAVTRTGEMRLRRSGAVGVVTVVVGMMMAAAARDRQAAVSDISEPKSIPRKVNVRAGRSVAEAAGQVRKLQNVRRAAEGYRGVREARSSTGSFLPFLSSFGTWTTAVTQMLSFLPELGNIVVRVLTSAVYLVGTGLAAAGTGLGLGSRAVEGVGRGLKTASSALPHVVSVLMVAGMSLVLFFPGVYDWAISTLASAGLAMAGHVTAAVRNFMDEDSPWGIILDSTSLFIRKLQRDFQK